MLAGLTGFGVGKFLEGVGGAASQISGEKLAEGALQQAGVPLTTDAAQKAITDAGARNLASSASIATPGASPTLGETLLNIVPDGEVEAKIYISNKDIGFVKPNMDAEIRLDAFPFTQYGSLKGKVLSIGDEVLPPDQINKMPRFPAYIKLNKQNNTNKLYTTGEILDDIFEEMKAKMNNMNGMINNGMMGNGMMGGGNGGGVFVRSGVLTMRSVCAHSVQKPCPALLRALSVMSADVYLL